MERSFSFLFPFVIAYFTGTWILIEKKGIKYGGSDANGGQALPSPKGESRQALGI